jgi:hypothetical protein
MAAIDQGTLAPAGTRLEIADVYFDGNVRFRSGGTVNAESGYTFPNNAVAPTTPTNGTTQYTNSTGVLASVSASGLVSAVGGAIQSQTTTSTVASTAALTPLQTFTVPANDPGVGAVYALIGYGTYSDTGTPTLTFTLTWGATTIATIPAITLGSGVTSVPFSYTAIVNFRTATSVTASITLNFGTVAATGAASLFTNTSVTPTTVVSNAASALAMNVTWSA